MGFETSKWVILVVIAVIVLGFLLSMVFKAETVAVETAEDPAYSPHTDAVVKLPEWDFSCIWNPLECLSPNGLVVDENS